MDYPTIEQFIGNTPLVRLQRLNENSSNNVLVKLEGNNPAGSVKDRPALSMIQLAEQRGDLKPGDTLIEATSGNTGIALAMAAAIKGYRLILIMPDNMTEERRAAMRAYGAELVLVSQQASMEGARDLADEMEARGEGRVLNQFANQDNPQAHYESTGPEIWRDTHGEITRSRLSVYSPRKERVFPEYVAGLKNTCQKFLIDPPLIVKWMYHNRWLRRPRVNWQQGKGFLRAYHRAER